MAIKHPKLTFLPPVIAHRGGSAYAPENTLPAILKAKLLGAKWVELDVQLTADGELVVFHDNTLARTTNGQGTIQEHTLVYLKSLDAGSWFADAFRGVQIPTLQEVITLIQQQDLAINIEIKLCDSDPVVMAEKMAALLAVNLAQKSFPFFISSFDTIVLNELMEINPLYPIAHLAHEWTNDWQEICDELNCIAFDLNYEIVTQDIVNEILASNRMVLAYTVNDLVTANRLFSWGVSALFSDCPDKIIQSMVKSPLDAS